MSISGICGSSGAGYSPPPAAGSKAAAPSSGSSAAAAANNTIEQQFFDYMKKTSAQRMVEAWLKAHHLTQKALDAMPPDQPNAIMKQMADDIKTEMKRKAEAKATAGVDLLA